MRFLLFTIFIIFSGLSFTVLNSQPVAAQSTQDMNNDLRFLGEWSEELNSFHAELVEIFNTEQFNVLLGYIDREDYTSDDFKQAYKVWREDTEKRIKRIREIEANFSPAPSVKTAELQPLVDALVEQRTFVPMMINDLQEMYVRFDNIVVRLISGDDSGVAELQQILAERAIQVMDLENASVEQMRATLKESDHPNYYVLGMSIQSNLLAADAVRIFTYTTTRKEREPYIREMKKNLAEGRVLEAQARRALTRTKGEMRSYLSQVGPSEKPLLEATLKILDSFDEALAVEARILGVFERQIEVFERTSSTEDLANEIAQLDTELYGLIDERLRLNQVRTRMLADMQ